MRTLGDVDPKLLKAAGIYRENLVCQSNKLIARTDPATYFVYVLMFWFILLILGPCGILCLISHPNIAIGIFGFIMSGAWLHTIINYRAYLRRRLNTLIELDGQNIILHGTLVGQLSHVQIVADDYHGVKIVLLVVNEPEQPVCLVCALKRAKDCQKVVEIISQFVMARHIDSEAWPPTPNPA